MPSRPFPASSLDAMEFDLLPFTQVSESSEDTSEGDHELASCSSKTYKSWLNDGERQKRGRPTQKPQKEESKRRKTTYDIRREEKVELTAQVKKMQTQLEELKYRVLVEQGEAAKSNERVVATNSVLQELIQEQHVELANMQASLSSHLQQNMNSLTPAHTIIHLGTDLEERHKTLTSLKNKKLQEAKGFVTARSRGLDPTSAYSQEERNSVPGEDYSVVLFESTPIHGASAREVFEAFIDVAQNAEIIISEMFGSITIRENNEVDARDISHMRFVTSTSQGALVESNTAMFSEFVENTDGDELNCGMVVADFVDSDELYPYKSKERVQRDTTTVFMIRTLKHSPQRSDGSSNGSEDDIKRVAKTKQPIVVATRWTCSKIRRSKMNLSADALRELQESTVSFGDTMKKCIQQRLGKSDITTPQTTRK